MVLSDGPVGVRGTSWDDRDWGATTPSPTALAASWDPDLVERVGELLGAEARRKGVDVLLAPTVNLHRTPYGGRHFECLSEDPHLTARIGAAYVTGVQRRGVGATVKHYVANDSETERMTYRAVVDEQTLHELYLRPFEEIVATARPWLVMAAYNACNGPTMTENDLLAEPLNGRWGFDGVVVSDWNAVRSTVPAALADTDLAMPGPTTPWSDHRLLDAVRSGEVPEAAIDRKLRRLLRLAERVGAFADPVPAPAPDRGTAALLRRAAAAGTVLLRNDGTLPLAPQALRRVALLGPGAEHIRVQGGGSAWVSPPYTVAPLAGLADALGTEVELVHTVGAVVDERLRAFSGAQATDPDDGTPGVRVRLRSADGAVFRDEHRDSGKLLWMQHADAAEIAEIEASCVFTAPDDGTYHLGFAAAGDATAGLDGAEFFSGPVVSTSDNHLAALLAPREVVHEVALKAGDRVRVDVRLRPGGLSRQIAMLTLGALPRRRSDDDELAHAAELAAGADVAVVVVGTTEQIESEGFDRESLALPGRQDDLVRAVAAANPRTVVVVNSGAPVELPWLDEVAAVVLTWFPGQEAGHAIADVLTGAVEPGGRMPTSWPHRGDDEPVLSPVPQDGRLVYAEGVHVGYRGWLSAGIEPALAFGSGLGYTTWRFDALELAPATDGALARVTLTNTGDRAGTQTVQVYLSRPASTVVRPRRWLAGFARVSVDAGERAVAEIVIDRSRFAHWSVIEHDWALEPGTFEVHAGASVLDTPLGGEWELG
jgi:beta-glucosidase